MQKTGPLHGIKVLDLSSVLMGPLATQMLGDMGADVIKIEAPEGDISRAIGSTRHPGMASLFLSINRNKRSLVLDLKKPGATAVLHRLVKDCDVLIHSVRSAGMERAGMDYATLAKHNPQLIYCHLKGFADEGAYAGLPAFDDMIQALSGIADLQSVIAGEPRFFPQLMADKVCGMFALNAVSMGLIHRLRTGRGQQIDLSMFETMVSFNLAEHLFGECFVPPVASMGYTSLRTGVRRPQRTQDGFISLWPVTDAQWNRLFELTGRLDALQDPNLNSVVGRVRRPDAVAAFFEQVMPARTTQEWVTLCRAQDLPAAPVNTLEGLLQDPHLQSVNFWLTAQHPSEGELRVLPNPINLSDSPSSVRRLAPRLGEHTREVLAEFGYDAAAIAQMEREGMVRGAPSLA